MSIRPSYLITAIVGAMCIFFGYGYAVIGEAGLISLGWPRAAALWYWAQLTCTLVAVPFWGWVLIKARS